MGVRHHSILETVVVDVRTVVEIHILQVEKEEPDTTIVSLGEVGIPTVAGNGSVVVALVLGTDTGYAEAEVAGENTSFGGVEGTYSARVVGWR